jgi:hypothetical protein
MSTKPFDLALDLANSETRRLPRTWLESVVTFVQAFREGLAAHRRYQTFVARGVPADQAVEMTFKATFGKG